MDGHALATSTETSGPRCRCGHALAPWEARLCSACLNTAREVLGLPLDPAGDASDRVPLVAPAGACRHCGQRLWAWESDGLGGLWVCWPCFAAHRGSEEAAA